MTTSECFSIDAKASHFTVQAFAGGGHNPTIAIRDFDGEARFIAGTLDKASLAMKIRAASLVVEDEMRPAERLSLEKTMREEVLATSRNPDVYYQSLGVQVLKIAEGLYKADIKGELNLNGITRPQDVTCQISFGLNSLRATGSFSIRQSGFGITPPKVAGGILTLRDELKFTYFIIARQTAAGVSRPEKNVPALSQVR